MKRRNLFMYNNIKLDKSLYSITGKTFTQALTELDPDEGYENTELKGFDAFERQLKRFGIRINGAGSDMVEKFFISAESAVLFPEFIRRCIKEGMDEASIAAEVCAAVSYTDGVDYRGLYIVKTGASDTCAEGAALPETRVTLAAESKRLVKYARRLSCSYESIRKQRIDTFAVVLRNLGAVIGNAVNGALVTELKRDISAMKNSGAKMTYDDLAAFWASMDSYNMNTMICSPAVMAKILALDEMKFVVSDYMANGAVKTPYGVTIIKCSALGDNTIIGVDADYAAEMILGTDVIVDYDKLISAQCEEISCSILAGFSRMSDYFGVWGVVICFVRWCKSLAKF